jgi:hypothetical protein
MPVRLRILALQGVLTAGTAGQAHLDYAVNTCKR